MKRAIGIAVVLLLSLGFLALPVQGSADKPAWNVGEKWAIGMESETPTQTDIDAMEESFKMLFNLSEISIDVSGGGGIWMTFEVTDVSDSEYTMHYSMAMRNNVDEDFQFSVMTAEPGTYTPETFRDAPKTPRDMSAHMSLELYVVASGDMTIDKESMGVKSVSVDLEEKFEMSFTGKNLPSVDEFGIFGYPQLAMYYPEYEYDDYEGYDWDENYTYEEWDYNFTDTNYSYAPSPVYPLPTTSHTLSYEDVDIEVVQTLNLDLNINYDPPAVFIDFPLMEGNTWSIESHETVTGTYSGIIDAKGLPPMMEAGMVLGTGQSFPVKIEKINTYSPDFNNGVISHSGPMWMNLSCPDTMQIKDENGNYIQVYKIHQLPDCEYCYGPDIYLLYSPDKGFIAGIYAPASEENLMPMMPGMESSGIYGSFGALSSSLATSYKNDETLGYMDYNEASKEIFATSQEMKGITGDEDFFESTLFFILLGVAIATAVIIAMIAMGRRKKAVPTHLPPQEVQQAPDAPEAREPPEF